MYILNDNYIFEIKYDLLQSCYICIKARPGSLLKL